MSSAYHKQSEKGEAIMDDERALMGLVFLGIVCYGFMTKNKARGGTVLLLVSIICFFWANTHSPSHAFSSVWVFGEGEYLFSILIISAVAFIGLANIIMGVLNAASVPSKKKPPIGPAYKQTSTIHRVQSED
jgi:hypothetical protein